MVNYKQGHQFLFWWKSSWVPSRIQTSCSPLHHRTMTSQKSQWNGETVNESDKGGAGRWSGDSVVWGEVNSAEGIGRQWSGLMSHETGFTGAEALPNPPAIHFAITMISRRLSAAVRRRSCATSMSLKTLDGIDCLLSFQVHWFDWASCFRSCLAIKLRDTERNRHFWATAKGETGFKLNPGWHLAPSKGAPSNSSPPPVRGKIQAKDAWTPSDSETFFFSPPTVSEWRIVTF